jgi:type VI secretion system secreted protein VgrG
MRDTTLLGPWVRRFLLEHLIGERNLARNTQQSYRDTLCQLIPFASARVHKPVDRLAMTDVSAEIVRDFLSDIEVCRGCSVATRNQRLAAIHALARFVGEHVSVSTGGGFFASARNALRLFVYQAGMRLIAASGDIDLKALKDNINLLAKLNVTVTATKVTISAQQEVEINGGGSYTRWTASQIKSGTSGGFEVHSASRTFVGPDSVSSPNIPALPPEKEQLHFALQQLPGEGHQVVSEPYDLYKGGAKIGEGVTDEFGRIIVKDHQAGTPAYTARLSNGAEYDLNVKDALEADPDHVDQRTNWGERYT